jgi:hypothetical protein
MPFFSILKTSRIPLLLLAALLTSVLTLGSAPAHANSDTLAEREAASAPSVPAGEETLMGTMSVRAQEVVVGTALVGGALTVGMLATGSLVTGLSAAGAVIIVYTFLP